MLLFAPFAVFLAAVAVAAAHRFAGEPLGARFADRVADVAQTLGLYLVAYGPFAGYVQRANARAAAQRTDASVSPHHPAPEGPPHDHDDDGRPTARRRAPAAPR
jgi:hypothetical protein